MYNARNGLFFSVIIGHLLFTNICLSDVQSIENIGAKILTIHDSDDIQNLGFIAKGNKTKFVSRSNSKEVLSQSTTESQVCHGMVNGSSGEFCLGTDGKLHSKTPKKSSSEFYLGTDGKVYSNTIEDRETKNRSKDYLESLRKQLSHKNHLVCKHAALALAELGAAAKCAVPDLRKLLISQDDQISIAAATALESILYPKAVTTTVKKQGQVQLLTD